MSSENILNRVEVVCFDVNETLLDLSVLDPGFSQFFGETEARHTWFLILQELVLTSVITAHYTPFSELCQSSLQMLAAKKNVPLRSADRRAILGPLSCAPAFAEVDAALGALRTAGFRLAALTNGELASARSQLNKAGIADYLPTILSADEIKRFKPAAEPYLMAAARMHIETAQMLMVAAHGWDLAGAAAAGCRTAFIARPGKVLNPSAAKPTMAVRDLAELVAVLQPQREAVEIQSG